MRIVIDLQGAQTSSAKRGIGRYSLELVKAILRNHRGHEIVVALNGLFAETAVSIRRSLDGLLPRENIVQWKALSPATYGESANLWRRRASELLRESFMARDRKSVV